MYSDKWEKVAKDVINKHHREVTLQGILIVVAILLTVVCIIAGISKNIIFRNMYTVKVTDKTVKHYKSGDDYKDKYLIFTEDVETGEVRVFEDTDMLIPFKFNSSDVYATMKIGNTYKIEVRGIRNQFLSWYQNIYKVEEVG